MPPAGWRGGTHEPTALQDGGAPSPCPQQGGVEAAPPPLSPVPPALQRAAGRCQPRRGGTAGPGLARGGRSVTGTGAAPPVLPGLPRVTPGGLRGEQRWEMLIRPPPLQGTRGGCAHPALGGTGLNRERGSRGGEGAAVREGKNWGASPSRASVSPPITRVLGQKPPVPPSLSQGWDPRGCDPRGPPHRAGHPRDHPTPLPPPTTPQGPLAGREGGRPVPSRAELSPGTSTAQFAASIPRRKTKVKTSVNL